MDFSTLELPEWVLWIAQDEDGTWWAYECEPLEYGKGWYENEVGRRKRLAVTNPNPDWRSSLKKVRR